MSVAAIGALAGVALALAELIFLSALIRRVDLPETKTALRVAGAIQLVLFPDAGWFIAPLAFGD